MLKFLWRRVVCANLVHFAGPVTFMLSGPALVTELLHYQLSIIIMFKYGNSLCLLFLLFVFPAIFHTIMPPRRLLQIYGQYLIASCPCSRSIVRLLCSTGCYCLQYKRLVALYSLQSELVLSCTKNCYHGIISGMCYWKLCNYVW